VNGHDGFLWANRTGAMRHSDPPNTKHSDGFVGKASKDWIQFVLPGIKLKTENFRVTFGFSGEAEKTYHGSAAIGWKAGEQGFGVQLGRGLFNHNDACHGLHDCSTSFKPHASMA
jgi:hypothetical protein